MQQITEFEKKIESLINEITEFKDQIYYLQSCKENQSNWKRIDIEKRIPITQNEILEDKILKKESECDKYLEYYLRCNQLIESEMKIKDLIVTFQMQFMEIIKDAEILKEEYGNKANELIKELIDIEKERKNEKYSKLKRINYRKLFVKTKKWYEIILEKAIRKDAQKRNQLVEKYLSIKEMIMIEKDSGRYIDQIVFNSEIQPWKKSISYFWKEIMNKSNILILIETMDEKRFGCYIHSQLNEMNKYISDTNAFIFKIENSSLLKMENVSIKKYPIKDMKNCIKIGDERSEDLFIIGKNDIIIKKEDHKEKCSCSQKSFEYEKENSLIERKGTFEVKRFHIIETISEEEWQQKLKRYIKRKEIYQTTSMRQYLPFNEMTQLEELIGLKCDEILFDSNKDNWNLNHSVFNNKIIKRKQIVFLIEDEENGRKFGYYLNTQLIEKYRQWIETDTNSFLFTIQSNNQLNQPMKFEIKNMKWVGYKLYEKTNNWLIELGDIKLYKKDSVSKSNCEQNEYSSFDYHGIDKALCGKLNIKPRRILVIQMI